MTHFLLFYNINLAMDLSICSQCQQSRYCPYYNLCGHSICQQCLLVAEFQVLQFGNKKQIHRCHNCYILSPIIKIQPRNRRGLRLSMNYIDIDKRIKQRIKYNKKRKDKQKQNKNEPSIQIMQVMGIKQPDNVDLQQNQQNINFDEQNQNILNDPIQQLKNKLTQLETQCGLKNKQIKQLKQQLQKQKQKNNELKLQINTLKDDKDYMQNSMTQFRDLCLQLKQQLITEQTIKNYFLKKYIKLTRLLTVVNIYQQLGSQSNTNPSSQQQDWSLRPYKVGLNDYQFNYCLQGSANNKYQSISNIINLTKNPICVIDIGIKQQNNNQSYCQSICQQLLQKILFQFTNVKIKGLLFNKNSIRDLISQEFRQLQDIHNMNEIKIDAQNRKKFLQNRKTIQNKNKIHNQLYHRFYLIKFNNKSLILFNIIKQQQLKMQQINPILDYLLKSNRQSIIHSIFSTIAMNFTTQQTIYLLISSIDKLQKTSEHCLQILQQVSRIIQKN